MQPTTRMCLSFFSRLPLPAVLLFLGLSQAARGAPPGEQFTQLDQLLGQQLPTAEAKHMFDRLLKEAEAGPIPSLLKASVGWEPATRRRTAACLRRRKCW